MAEHEQPSHGVPEELQAKVRTFFEIYDPERLQSSNSDFNVLLRYIANRGLPALEDKLMRKYGVNIASMSEEDIQKPPADEDVTPPPDFTSGVAGPKELEDLPHPLLPSTAQAEVQEEKRASYGLGQINPILNPATGAQEAPDRAIMFQRLTEFYKQHNKEKLKTGIGNIVDYAIRNGEGKINAKLFGTYGQDLTGFENERKQVRRLSQKHEEIGMLKEEQNVTKMAPQRQKLRQELIDFFLVLEPERAALRMDPLLDYAEKHGLAKLNGKLFSKYGYNLDTVPTKEQLHKDTQQRIAQFSTVKPKPVKMKTLDENLERMKEDELPEWVPVMLTKYYAKFDQVMLEEGGVDRVHDWAKRNGMNKLNRKLKERYGTSLAEFVKEAHGIRDELIEFYRHRDKNKLVTGIQAILDWGLKNGRKALNEKLMNKYGVGLDMDNDLYNDVMESASQF